MTIDQAGKLHAAARDMAPQPKHVLFVMNSLTAGGAERQVVSLINRLDPARLTLSLAMLKSSDALLPELDQERMAKVMWCNVESRIDWPRVRELATYVDDARVDVIVCTNQYPMIYAYLARRLCKRHCRLVEVLHSSELADIYERMKMFVYRPLFRRFDQVVFVSENQRSYWLNDKRLAVASSCAIQNGIDVQRFSSRLTAQERSELRRQWHFQDTDFVVGICAALRPEKRHVDVLEAVARCRADGLDAKLLIIGEGRARTQIEDRIESLRLGDAVQMTGFEPDVRPFLEICDCSVIASVAVETFSLAVLESMAMGKPVVSSRVGGADEQIIHGETGFLFTRADTAELAACLQRLADPALRDTMGRAARRRVEENFTLEKMVRHYQSVLCADELHG